MTNGGHDFLFFRCTTSEAGSRDLLSILSNLGWQPNNLVCQKETLTSTPSCLPSPARPSSLTPQFTSPSSMSNVQPASPPYSPSPPSSPSPSLTHHDYSLLPLPDTGLKSSLAKQTTNRPNSGGDTGLAASPNLKKVNFLTSGAGDGGRVTAWSTRREVELPVCLQLPDDDVSMEEYTGEELENAVNMAVVELASESGRCAQV